MNFRTNGSDAMRIDSSGKVGIGTSSPNQLLEVADSSGGATINISTDQAAGSIASKKYMNLDFSGYNNNVMARIQSWDESSSTGHGYLTFHTLPSGGSLTERMRIDSSGNLTTRQSTGNNFRVIRNGDNSIEIGNYNATDGYQNTSYVSSTHTFYAGTAGAGSATRAVDIDASGNLLVGKTASNYATEGVEIRSNEVLITKAGLNPLSVRSSGAGSIISLNTDGGNVGSIGVEGGDLTIGTGDTGLQFRDASDAIRPFNISTNAARDANIDLGRSSERFRDLYLSGTASMAALEPGVVTISSGSYFIGNATNGYRFNNAADTSNLMILRDNGDLLVGTTSAYGTTGTTINAAGLVYSSADGDRAGQFDRTGITDGEIVRFSKAGSTVGSIGNIEDLLYIATDDTTDCGIRFDGDNQEISPCTATGAYSDGNIDLGDGSARFKDLYLSGGIQSAGSNTFTWSTPMSFNKAGSDTYTKTVLYDSQNNTANNVFSGLTLEMGRLTNSSSATPRTFTISDRGATNRWCFSQYGLSFNPTNSVASAAESLDDYEEGTWTPTVTSSAGTITTVTSQIGTYTKIGRTVILQYQFNIATLGTASGNIVVKNHPFAQDNSEISYYAGVHRARSGTSSITEFDFNAGGTLQLYGTTPVAGVYLGSMVYNTTS
jgi:hypothetical protein